MVRAIMDPHQQICRGCDQIITLSEPRPEVEYCFDCQQEIEAWADLWKDQNSLDTALTF
jgi:hypothetical protein